MKRDYQIAGHRIRIEGCEAWVQAVSSLDGFKPFEVEVEGIALANFLYTDEEAPEMTEAQYESGVDGIVDVFGRYKGGYIFTMKTPEGATFCFGKRMEATISISRGSLSLAWYVLPCGLLMELLPSRFRP